MAWKLITTLLGRFIECIDKNYR